MSRRPLFQQQAFQPQVMQLRVLSGISPAFAGLSQTGRQVVYVLLTRAPLYLRPERRVRVRLACVRHAASVRSEPGSNSWFDAVCHLYPALKSRLPPGTGHPAPRPRLNPRGPYGRSSNKPWMRANRARFRSSLTSHSKVDACRFSCQRSRRLPRPAGPGAAAACSACHPRGAPRSSFPSGTYNIILPAPLRQ